MKVISHARIAALVVISSLFFLFQNCGPAKITSGDKAAASENTDLGSNAPPDNSSNNPPSSTPTPAPDATPTPAVTPTPATTPTPAPTPTPGPVMSLSTNSLNFGNVSFGDSATRTIVVTNIGTETLRSIFTFINAIYFSEDVFVSNCRTLNPGQSCNIAVTFDAFTTTSTTGILRVESNAINSPLLVQLQGQGVP